MVSIQRDEEMNALDPEHVKRSKLRSRDVLDDVLNAVCFVFFVALRTIRVCGAFTIIGGIREFCVGRKQGSPDKFLGLAWFKFDEIDLQIYHLSPTVQMMDQWQLSQLIANALYFGV